MKRAALIAWAALSTLLYKLVLLPFDLLGFFLVPLAIAFGEQKVSSIYPQRIIFTAPRWLWLWGNEQDGFDPADANIPERYAIWRRNFATKLPGWLRTFLLRYLWAAWRNKTSNFRFLGLLKPKGPAHAMYGKYWFLVRYRWLVMYESTDPVKRRFTKIGARITSDWATFGVNFTFRYKARW